jgi:carbamoyl-phosphate synthase large subunit
MDPMRIHTIPNAPAMTFIRYTFQRMRDGILMMRSIGNFAGGCNVQFAVSPDEKEDIVAIESTRVSSSSSWHRYIIQSRRSQKTSLDTIG